MRRTFETLKLDKAALFVGGIWDGKVREMEDTGNWYRAIEHGEWLFPHQRRPLRRPPLRSPDQMYIDDAMNAINNRRFRVNKISVYYQTSVILSEECAIRVFCWEGISPHSNDLMLRILNYFSDNKFSEILQRTIPHRRAHSQGEEYREEEEYEQEPPERIRKRPEPFHLSGVDPLNSG